MNERCTICDYFPQHGIRARKFYHVEGEAICQECFSSIAEALKEFEEPEDMGHPTYQPSDAAVRSTSGLLDPIQIEGHTNEKDTESPCTVSEVRIE